MNSDLNQRQYGVVFVTASSRTEADAIAQALVTSKLAACVNLVPVHSIYTWNSELCADDEWQLIIKTDLRKFAALQRKICELHSYEVPEIIALPIVAGSPAYLSWMAQQVQD